MEEEKEQRGPRAKATVADANDDLLSHLGHQREPGRGTEEQPGAQDVCADAEG